MQFRHIYFFCSVFSKLSGIWRGTNALRRCPAGGRARRCRFRGNLGSIFFSIKNGLFSISISIKSGLAVAWTHWRSKKYIFFLLFFSLGRCNGAGPKITEQNSEAGKPPTPKKHENLTFFLNPPFWVLPAEKG